MQTNLFENIIRQASAQESSPFWEKHNITQKADV